MRGPQAPARNRPPAGGGGGIWGDSFSTRSNRPRPGYGVAADTAAGSGMGGRQNLDALRANRLRQQGIAEPEEESEGGFTAGKAILIILLMFVLGAGGAYAYFKISTPRVHSNAGTGSSSRSSISGVGSTGKGTSTSLATNHSVVFTLMSGPEHTVGAFVYRPKI